MEELTKAIALLQSGQPVDAATLLAMLQAAAAAMQPAPAAEATAPAAPSVPAAPAAPAAPKGDTLDVEAVRTKILADARKAANDRARLLADAAEVLEHVDTDLADNDLRAQIVLAVCPQHEGLLAATDDDATIRALCDAAVATYRSHQSTARVLDSRTAGGKDPIAALVDSALAPWVKPKTEGTVV